jgi:hypothetical protein
MAESLLHALEESLRTFEKHRMFLLSYRGSSSAPPPPYLARKHEQKRLLALPVHHSPTVEGDIRAWVAAMIEWSAAPAPLSRRGPLSHRT